MRKKSKMSKENTAQGSIPEPRTPLPEPPLSTEQVDYSKCSVESSQYDSQGNGEHYRGSRIESIDMMERIWGTYELMVFCEMNAFKYRHRLGKKKGQTIALELTKIAWYENKAKELRNKIDNNEGVINHDQDGM